MNAPHHTILKVAALFIMLATFTATKAQENNTKNEWPYNKIIEYTHDKIHQAEELINDKLHKAENLINEKLDKRDSIYVTPNIYNMTVMTQYSYAYEYYRFNSRDDRQSISLKPENNNKVGLYVGWRWLFLGWSFDMTKNSAKKDISLSFYTAKIGFDLLYRRRDEGFRISGTKGFLDSNGNKITSYEPSFKGFSTKQKGVNVYYIFNNKKFSYPAAYSQTTNQRISAGSFILGLTYNEQIFKFDYSKMAPELQEALNDGLKFNKVKYKDFSVNFGYSYNWVFAKNCLANISLTPCVGYKNSSLKINDSKEFISNINFDFISRVAVVYNNSKYYVGASFISHTYSYRKSKLSVINGFGIINVYAGFNFWKKKTKK